MAGSIDYEKIYEVYEESTLGKLTTGAAMGAASLFGNTPSTMEDTTYNSEYADQKVLSIDEFTKLWSKYYQTTEDPEKEARSDEVLADGINIPQNAKDAIDAAVYVFGGDMGVTPNVLEDLLVYTGEVESKYETRRQVKGPALSYWQVEPDTAMDNLKNGSSLIGDKFNKIFKKELDYIGYDSDNPQRGLNKKKVMVALEKSDRFGAAMAAMWWIRKAHKAL